MVIGFVKKKKDGKGREEERGWEGKS